MRAIAPKIKQRKGSPSQSSFSDDDEEDNQVTNGEKDGTRQPNIHHQPPSILMTSEVDMDTAKQQPKNPRQLTDLSMLKFPDPIQISIFEWDSGVSESISSKNPYFSSFSKLKSPRNPQVSVLEVAEVSKEENLNILGPFSGDYISTRTVLSDGKSNKVPTLNNK